MNDTQRGGHGPGDDAPFEEPLPRSWLPAPRPGEDDAYWDGYAARVLAELEPLMAARSTGAVGRARSWVSEIGDRWGAAGLLAAAAVATLVVVGMRERAAEPSMPGRDEVTLALVAAEGDPAMMWEGLGIPADPLLARLTLAGGGP
jgi:hypothetical protein